MPDISLSIPAGAQYILRKLMACQYHAYLVGGCVRDILLGKTPHDYDITTNATPEQIHSVFDATNSVIDTGLKHGTVTVISTDNQLYEVTTFRTESGYSDNRHPDTVNFVDDVTKDLARRDFTINAIAMDINGEIIDPFFGQNDLANGIVRCVGNPDDRFAEDALRILRAIRFTATYPFVMDWNTMTAVRRNKDKLRHISAERLRDEFCKILSGITPFYALHTFSDVISVIIPEITPCIGFQQNSIWHTYDVYTHIIHAVRIYNETGGTDLQVKLALFFHDIGKPDCYTTDDEGHHHFHGHGAVSSQITDNIMQRLRFDNHTRNTVVKLVYWHDVSIEATKPSCRRWLNKLGPDLFRQLLIIRKADILAQSSYQRETRLVKIDSLQQLLNEILEEQSCFSMKDLQVNGHDMIELGLRPGPDIGAALNRLLQAVIAEQIPNEKSALIRYVKENILP